MLVLFDEKMKDIANKIKEFIKIINVDGDGNVNIFSDKGLKHNGEHVYGAKVLYDNASGTTGTVTLNESAENFAMLEIIAGFSDVAGVSQIVYEPNGKTFDVSFSTAGSNNTQNARSRLTVSGLSITQAYNAISTVTKTPAFQYTASGVYIKTVIGYR